MIEIMAKQIHIAIDGNEANVTNRVGSNMYAFELIKAIYQIVKQRSNLKITVLLSSEKLMDLPPESKKWQYQLITPKKFWTQWALPLHLFWHSKKYDVFFTPGHYAPRICSISYISSVMDLAYLYYPNQFKKEDLLQLTKWTKYSVKNAKKVLTISQSTQADVIKKYHRAKQDVFVAYPALVEEQQITQQEAKNISQKLDLKNPYLVYVGTLQPRKNLVTLIEAFEKTKTDLTKKQQYYQQKTSLRRIDLTKLELIIAGKIGWLADDIVKKVAQSNFSESIRLLGYVSEKEKQVLLKNAQASLLVGLYEGFGIPPLESISHGTIAIVSNSSSLPEVVGEAGILVNEKDSSSIAEGIRQALVMSAHQKAVLRKKMREQVKRFSWEDSAEKVLEELLSIISGK